MVSQSRRISMSWVPFILFFLFIHSQSGFMSMVFYQRNSHIAEIQMGKPSLRLEDALSAENFDINEVPYVTLIGKWNMADICKPKGEINFFCICLRL